MRLMATTRSARSTSRRAREAEVTCPGCGRRNPWSGNPQRPFCSLECRLLDLGRWLDERYRIAGPAVDRDPWRQDDVP